MMDCKIVQLYVYPMITILNFLYSSPISGLEKKSAIIKCVGQYSTLISNSFILSFTKKYLICMSLEFPVHEFRLFFSIQIVLWLSWYITFFYRISLCTHEHYETYVVWNIFAHSYKLRLCGAFYVYLLFRRFSMHYSITHIYSTPCMSSHINMHSIDCIYPLVQVR